MPRTGSKMTRSSRKVVTASLAVGGLVLLASQAPAFVPAPATKAATRRLQAPIAAAPLLPGLLAAAPAAFADQIGDAAAKFSDAAYPVAEKFEWGTSPVIAKYLADVSAKNPKAVARAVEKLLEVGVTMDPKLIQAAVKAHEQALESAQNSPNLVADKASFAAVNDALARMIASADPERFFYLLSAFPGNKELQLEFFKGNNEGDAKAAYEAFVGLTNAVRAASESMPHAAPSVPPVPSSGPVAEAAKLVAETTYPLVQAINWGNTPQISKYIAEASAKDPKGMAKAVKNVLEVGSSMDMGAVQTAVNEHAKAVADALTSPKLVTSKAEYIAVMQSLAAMIKTADPAKFNAIRTDFPGNAELQDLLFAANNAGTAESAYKTFVSLTEAVAR